MLSNHQKNPGEKKIMVSTKTLSSTTVSNIDNNNNIGFNMNDF